MPEVIHIDATLAAIIGGIISLFLGVITFFLSRLLKQFDGLNKIVGEIATGLAVSEVEKAQIIKDLSELDPLWDRMRAVETRITTVEAGGCKVIQVCKGQ